MRKENEKEPLDDENIDEEDESPKKKQGLNGEIKSEESHVDYLSLVFFIGFLCCVFYFIFGLLIGLYPFQTEGEWIGGTFIGSGAVFVANAPLLYILYWSGFICLLLGFYRIKWDPKIIVLIGILGTLIFFVFFIKIFY
ncbi:MAG: hypothetical protein ACTSVE_02510 [Candidatus Helarchaeota archaeon]